MKLPAAARFSCLLLGSAAWFKAVAIQGKRYELAEIERERRAGYAYCGQQAASVLAAYPAWKSRH